jgi:uncharacterized protein YcfL
MNIKKICLIIIGGLLLSACGSDDSVPESGSDDSLPESGEITSDELYSSSVSQDGYDSMTISSDSSLTLVTDEFTLSNNNNGEPQKLTVAGNLTIKK